MYDAKKYHSNYYRDNKDDIKKKNKDYRKNHKRVVTEADKAWRKNNTEKIKLSHEKIRKKYRDKYNERKRMNRIDLKKEVFNHYGNKCLCCGENKFEFLTIDHINGGGTKHRKEVGADIYKWLKRNSYPDGYRVLCFNCNCSIAYSGYCPHGNLKREFILNPKIKVKAKKE